FIRNEHLHRKAEKHLAGPADLVVEVVSPGSERLDRVVKRAEYEEGGVPEYWVIDPHNQRVDFFVLDDDGRYRSVAPVDGEYRAREVDGFRLRVEWLWERPPVFRVLGQLLDAWPRQARQAIP